MACGSRKESYAAPAENVAAVIAADNEMRLTCHGGTYLPTDEDERVMNFHRTSITYITAPVLDCVDSCCE